MQTILNFLNTYIFGPALPIVVFLAGSFLFLKYGSFIIFRQKTVLSVLMRKNNDTGISPFKTAMLALASTLGVGNIVGVSTAIFLGGPGAVFWLTVSAFAAMPLKYGEVVLAMKYRKKEDGEYRGGAMYYIRECINNKRLSVVFAILCIINAFTVGNIVQVNALTESFESVFSLKPIYVGTITAVVIFLSLRKGTESISGITSKLVPFATALYMAFSLFIIVSNYSSLSAVASLVFKSAFNVKAVFGGIGGYSIIKAMRYGVARGIMSNEAGSGTSPTAHAKSNLESAVEQGFWGIFEVFADTVIMCNMTAFVILLSFDEFVLAKGFTGMELVIASYGRYMGNIADIAIAISVMLFACATVISQGFYGGECVHYLTKSKGVMKLYRFSYCLIIIYGAVADSDAVWSLTDFNISLMTVINTICLLVAANEIKKETFDYFHKSKKSSRKKREDNIQWGIKEFPMLK
ncbi:MAG: sodium:alanine symporter family protein [Clostridia bacterium]|nr:sodium:alanine symporter family protein [Clostridia bacterium]